MDYDCEVDNTMKLEAKPLEVHMKQGVNMSDKVRIKEYFAAGHNHFEIAQELNINPDCVLSFMPEGYEYEEPETPLFSEEGEVEKSIEVKLEDEEETPDFLE